MGHAAQTPGAKGAAGEYKGRRPAQRAPKLSPAEAEIVLGEPETDELEERLRSSATAEAYLRDLPATDLLVTDYLAALLTSHGVRKSEVVRRSGFNETHCYQIFQGKRGADRNRVIKLALAFPLSLRETQRLLSRFGYARLWPKDPRDAIIIFGIEHGQGYEIIDDELYRLHYDPLTEA